MRDLALLIAALAGPAWGQFTQFSVTDDGKDIYFVSPLVLKAGALKGISAASEARLFRLAPGGLTLSAERGALAIQGSGSSSDGVSSPWVSGDGSIVAFTMHNICPNTGDCSSFQTHIQSEAFIRGKLNLDLGPGSVTLSRNGRYAIVSPDFFDPQTGNPTGPTALLIDLTTNDRVILPRPPDAMEGSPLASDGTVVVQQISSTGRAPVGLWKQGQFTPILSAAGTAIRVIGLSDDASTLIISTATLVPPYSITLSARRLATGEDTPLFTSSGPPGVFQYPIVMGLSNDGRRVLYRIQNVQNAGPAFVADASTGVSAPVALPDGELAAAGTLSGAGDTAILVTTAGRIVRVNLATSAFDTLVPATPYISNLNPLAPGSFGRLHGAFRGTVDSWTGQLLLNDQPLPVLAVQDGELDIQVPWEARTGSGSLRFANPGDSPFETAQSAAVVPLYAAPEFADPATPAIMGLKMIKGDFSGLVTAPPAPGDIVHLYLTGLGAVQRPEQTGVPAALAVPNPIVGTITCRFLPQMNADTLFAGLAPGMIGIYQVSLRMPADAGSAPISGFGCDAQSASGSGGFTIFGAAVGQ